MAPSPTDQDTAQTKYSADAMMLCSTNQAPKPLNLQ